MSYQENQKYIELINSESDHINTISEIEFKRVLKEEILNLITDDCFDEEGKFTKCRQGRVVSKTINQKNKGYKDVEPQKGYYTAKGKVRSKYGMPKTCGRIDIDGNKIPVSKRKSCKDFPNKYPSDVNEADTSEMDTNKICLSLGYVKKNEAFKQALLAISALEKASKGKV